MPVAVPSGPVPSSSSAEVFERDHRFINRYCRPQNGLVRYSLDLMANGQPLVEVWSGSAWVAIGSYLLQAWDGAVYTPLPVQTMRLGTVSPEETSWEEMRFDAGGTALVRTVNRIRRGSRLIESQIVAASGQGLTGPSSVALSGTGMSALATAGDGTGVVGATGSTTRPGFAYLTAPVVAATLDGSGALSSGLSVPAGTVGRIAILAGYADDMWTALGSDAAYVQRWAQYNRVRVRQRLVIS